MVEAGDDGRFAEVPWASVFDPEINMRAVGAVQQRGFRAATDVVNRLVRMTGQAAQTVATAEQAEAAEPQQSEFDSRTDADRLLRTWQRLASELLESIRTAGPGGGGSVGVGAQFDLATARSRGELRIEAVEPGPARGEIWLHNHGPVDFGKIRLRCSDLLSHRGAVVPAGALRLDPDPVAMPARSSRGVTVEIDVAAGLEAGSYRGALLVEGHDDVWMPVLVVVRPTE